MFQNWNCLKVTQKSLEENCKNNLETQFSDIKVDCVLPMVIWSEFRMEQYGVDNHWEDASHFTNQVWPNLDHLYISM